MGRRMNAFGEIRTAHTMGNDAQPGAQPDGPARGSFLVFLGAARWLARSLGLGTHRHILREIGID